MIYTFYSYKGGVGRSMALANLAKWFYMHNLRVVIVDWDLEAPGLENFFFDPETSTGKEEVRRAQDRPGLIDLLIRYQRRFPALPIPPWSKTLTQVLRSVLPSTLPEPLQGVETEALLKTVEQRLPPSFSPAYDRIDTAAAVDLLGKYLPPTLAGSTANKTQILHDLKENLPKTLNLSIEQVDVKSLLKTMEETWTATPYSRTADESVAEELDMKGMLAVLADNLVSAPAIPFDQAYIEPLLQLLNNSLPTRLSLPLEKTTDDLTSDNSVDTEEFTRVLRENLPPNFITSVREEYAATLLKTLDENLPPFSSMLFPIYEGPQAEEPDPGVSSDDDRPPGLWLLSAGWRVDERFPVYAQQVQSFDWTDFYNFFHGEAYFEWMRTQLNYFADIVLIDSRTGVTEMGGVCTRQLADVVVSLVAPNGQNLNGVATMVESFQRKEVVQARRKWEKISTTVDGTLEVVNIPARVETSETDLRNAFEERFSEQLDTPPISFQKVNTSFWDLKIPYVPYFSYNEKLVIGIGVGGKGRSEELEKAYKSLAVHLAMLAPPRSRIRKRFAKDLRDAFPTLLPGVTLIAYMQSEYDAANELCEKLEAEGIPLSDEMVAVDGPDGDRQVVNYLEQCESLVIVPSREFATSPVVVQQWRAARSQGKCVYVVGKELKGAAKSSNGQRLPAGAQVFDVDSDWSSLLRSLQSPCKGVRAPQMAPAPPDGFFAHSKDLVQLKSKLLRQDWTSAPQSRTDVAVCGMGGSGKSTLVAQLCYDEEVLNYFSGGVLWATLGVNPNITAELTNLYAALTGERPAFATADDACIELTRKLAGQNCLMVIDDVWDRQDLRFFTKSAESAAGLVITTRDRSLAIESAAHVVFMSGIETADAVSILTSSVTTPADQADVRDELNMLVDRLGRSPLVLNLAGAELARRLRQAHGVREAVQYLTQAVLVQGAVAFDVPETEDRNLSVAKSMALSVDRLSEHERVRYARLAEFDESEPITLDMISQKWADLSRFRSEQLVERFSYLSLITYDPLHKIVTLNPLLRSYLIEQAFAISPVQEQEKPDSTIDSGNVQKARNVLRGQTSSQEDLFNLAMQLKRENEFGLARRLLIRIRKDPKLNDDKDQRLKVIQQLSLTTRRDPDLPVDEKLWLSFEILKEADEDLNVTKNQETLGLAGAIFKEMWAVDGQRQHLERSLGYYLRGHKVGVAGDFGYTSINAAYVLDLLADQEATEADRAGLPSEIAKERRAGAEKIRQQIVDTLPGLASQPGNEFLSKQWWFLVTLAEAYFGLKRYDQALYWLKEAAALPKVDDWEKKVTAHQLASIARLNDEISEVSFANAVKEPKAWEVLRVFLKNDVDAVRSSFVGKVGLALSGGGFRASLFHIGVLAMLAEFDVLRKVEVLSCVSGGSIIGAHYYLEVQKLLETKLDAEIGRDDYIEIVKRIEKDFLDGVQRNVRTRVAGDPLANLRLVFQPNYSRTERVGELYESEIFSRAVNRRGALYLDEMVMRPTGESFNFRPRVDNWRRANKVPVLILNATTLNTGHNWQFTVSWMGEPPSAINTEVDGNDRLRRMYYHQAPKPHNRIRLGHAVAASACVPGLFEPLALSNLYPEKTVRLVDGGVHDNQGIAGVLGEECKVVLVSDASGQMGTVNNPKPGAFGVAVRSNSILMSRVRETEYREVDALRRSSLIRGLMFIHLKKDLQVEPVDWVGCDDPYEAFDESHTAERRGSITSYGVRKSVQQRLSSVRTDLDSFSEKEAYALMLSGYRMAGKEFAESIKGFPPPSGDRPPWRFLSIEKQMDRVKGFEEAHLDLLTTLTVGSSRAFKVWKLEPLVPSLFLLGSSVVIGLLIWLITKSERLPAFLSFVNQKLLGAASGVAASIDRFFGFFAGGLATAFRAIFATAIVMLLLYIVWNLIQKVRRQKPLTQIAVGLVMALVGWPIAIIHLYLFDRIFLRQGRVDGVSPPSSRMPRSLDE